MSIVFSHVDQTSKYNLKLSFEKRVFETYQDPNCLKGLTKIKKVSKIYILVPRLIYSKTDIFKIKL